MVNIFLKGMIRVSRREGVSHREFEFVYAVEGVFMLQNLINLYGWIL